MKKLTYQYTHEGYCQVYFIEKETKRIYCWRENYANCFELDICTPSKEADHPVDANRFEFNTKEFNKDKLCGKLIKFLSLNVYSKCKEVKSKYWEYIKTAPEYEHIFAEGQYQHEFIDLFPDLGKWGLVSIWESVKNLEVKK